MTTGLPISTVVDIRATIEAGGVLRQDFGLGLLLTVDDAISAGGEGKIGLYRDLESVTDVFGSGDVADDAAVWFGASPSPKSLYIARWANVDVDTSITGTTPGAVAAIAVNNATFRVADVDIAVNLLSQSSYTDIATAINGALTGGTLSAVEFGTAGSDYVVGDSIAFTGGGAARPATARVSSVDSDGAITGVEITDGGSGYTADPTAFTITTSAGTGAAGPTYTRSAPAASLVGASFTFSNSVFVLTLAGPAAFDQRFSTASDGSGTDISALLGMGTGAQYVQGSSMESATEAIAAAIDFGTAGAPVAIMLCRDLFDVGDSLWESVAAWAQGGDYVFGLLDTSDQALVANDDSSLVANAFERSQDKVFPFYSMSGERPDVGGLALLSAQRLDLPSSIITAHLKALPNVQPTQITETQRAELERKRTNIYTTIGGLPALLGGYSARAGSWIDAVWWLLWLKNEMSTNIYNSQRSSRRFATVQLTDVIHEVMASAIRNGGVQQGGRVSSQIQSDIRSTTGNEDFNGRLPSGYLAWVESPAVRSQLDRENRIGRFKVWVAPADAIHKVTGDIVLSA